MNGKLVVKTGLITAAVIAVLAYFSYNASYNPDFSALDFITSASPKKKAKNRKDVQETVYSIQDFALNEPLDGFDEIPVETGILLRRKNPMHTPMLFPVDADSPVYLKKCTRQADFLREQGYEIQMRPCRPFEFTALIHAGKFDLLLLTDIEAEDAAGEDRP
jgi:hypothetical protein